MKHYLLISGLNRMYSIDVLTIYWAAKYYIRLRCTHNVFVRNIGPVTLCVHFLGAVSRESQLEPNELFNIAMSKRSGMYPILTIRCLCISNTILGS